MVGSSLALSLNIDVDVNIVTSLLVRVRGIVNSMCVCVSLFICMSVCLSVRLHISKMSEFDEKCFVHATCIAFAWCTCDDINFQFVFWCIRRH